MDESAELDLIKKQIIGDIENEKTNYIENISKSYYKEDYQKILEYIKDLKSDSSSEKILKLIDMIEEYRKIYEYEPLNKIKSKIQDYNEIFRYHKNDIINEDEFINIILNDIEDAIGYHIFEFFVKTMGIVLECFIKNKLYLIKNNLITYKNNLNIDFEKLSNNFERDFDLSKEEIDVLIEKAHQFKNEYKSKYLYNSNLFEIIKREIYTNNYSIINKLLFNNNEMNEFKEIREILTPLINFCKSYFEEKKLFYIFYLTKKINFKNILSNLCNIFIELIKYYYSLNKENNQITLFNNGNIVFKDIIEGITELLSSFDENIRKKCSDNNFYKITINFVNSCKNIYNSLFNFIPQIEIKFNDVKEINKDIIDNLIIKIKEVLNNKNINIIEMKKGSLSICIALNFLIQDKINNINKDDINIEEFLKILNETLEIDVGNIKKLLEDNLILVQQNENFKPDFISENLFDLSTEESKNKLSNILKEYKNNKNCNSNIFEISKNITINDIKKCCETLFQNEKEQQENLCNIITNNELQQNLQNFDYQFDEAIKNSIFEYNIKAISYIFRDSETYKSEQLHCNNIEKKILFHGTNSNSIVRILSDNFHESKYFQFYGKGIYFSDDLDYIWRYSAEDENKENKSNFRENAGIKIGDSFSFIACEVYYDKLKFEQIYDREKEKTTVPKYGIRNIIVNNQGDAIKKEEIENFKKFKATEYLITEKEQILPLLSMTVERVEFAIIWRDNNFDSSNPNGYQYFKEMLEFNYKIKKYVSFKFKTRIYYFNETNEALKLIKRKKYNKIILITNGANNGEAFIDDARKIIGNNTIALVTCYLAKNHMNWVKNKENIFLNSKHSECIKEFITYSVEKNLNKLNDLQKKIEKDYKIIDKSFCFKEINEEAFRFPLYEKNKEGKLEDIDFSEDQISNNKTNNNTICSLI